MAQIIDKPKFARRLRTAIVNAGFATQKEFARAVGVSQATVSQYLRGESLPSIHTLFRICDVLDVAYDKLVDNEQTTK